MKRYATLLIATIFISIFSLDAQELSYGFKVGLNSSNIQGDKETDANGNELEEFKRNTGFHVGASFILKLTDQFGAKAQLLFSQKGGEYRYGDEGVQVLIGDSGKRVVVNGQRKIILTITNSYIDIPITGYAKLGERFEFFGGVSFGFLVGSTAAGELNVNGQSAITETPIEFTTTLDYDYFDDVPPTPEELRNSDNPFVFNADGENIYVPKFLGGYYNFAEKDKSYYNIFDVGLIGGINYYFNRGLYFGLGVNYGLSDVSNDTYDVSKSTINGTEYIPRSDKDNNFSIQASIGFSF